MVTIETSAISSEEAIVAAVWDTPDLIPEVRRRVKADDFYDPELSDYFAAITNSFEDHGEANDHDIAARIKEAGHTTVRLEHLARFCGSSSAVWDYHARKIVGASRLRKLVRACQRTIHDAAAIEILQPKAERDVDELLSRHLAAGADVLRTGELHDGVKLATAAQNVADRIASGESGMVATGVPLLDSIAGGMPRQGIVSVYGYPGASKSTLALTVARLLAAGSASEAPLPVRVVSYEMPPERIAATLMSQDAGTSIHGLLNRGAAPDDATLDSMAAFVRSTGPLNFKIYESNMDPPALFMEIVVLSHKQRGGVLVYDYIQDTAPFGEFTEQYDRITETMRILAQIARELGWLVIVVSQCGKDAAKSGRRPMPADALGSSAIEQRSDMILYVWRPHQHEPPPQDGADSDGFAVESDARRAWRARHGRVQIGVTKNKYGKMGMCDAIFDGEQMSFRPATGQEQSCWGNT